MDEYVLALIHIKDKETEKGEGEEGEKNEIVEERWEKKTVVIFLYELTESSRLEDKVH